MQTTYSMFLWAALAATLLSAHQQGCSSKGQVDGPPQPATEVRSVDFLQKKLLAKQQAFQPLQSLTARAQIVSEGEGMRLSASANLIWIRDSIIWMNAKKFGLEAMRVLITRDSVFILNRLEKTVMADGLETLRAQFSLPQGDVFGMLQNTLLGLPPLPVANGAKSDIADEQHRLLFDQNGFSADYRVEEGSFLFKAATFVKRLDNTTVRLGFSRHQKVEGIAGLFSLSRTVDAFSPDSGRQGAQIELEDVQVNTKPSYRFEIPDHYTRQ